MSNEKNFPISIAPMVGYTDRHFRYIIRGLTKKTTLYTEMINAKAVIKGDKNKLLSFSILEKPLVLQLAGSNVNDLVDAAIIAKDFGYDKINLNIGCPSPRAGAGRFGACLLLEAELVADCVSNIISKTNFDVSIKHRLSVTYKNKKHTPTTFSLRDRQGHAPTTTTYEESTFENLVNFVRLNSLAGCKNFIIHARTAFLESFSPKKNLTIPPLDYNKAVQLAKIFPDLNFELNGGIKDLSNAKDIINQKSKLTKNLNKIMIGRASYNNPLIFANADNFNFENKNFLNLFRNFRNIKSNFVTKSKLNSNSNSDSTNQNLNYFLSENFNVNHFLLLCNYIIEYLNYWEDKNEAKLNQNKILSHTLNLFKNYKGVKLYRNYICQNLNKNFDKIKLFNEALKFIEFNN